MHHKAMTGRFAGFGILVSLAIGCGKPAQTPLVIRNVTAVASPTAPRQPAKVELGHMVDGALHPQTKFELVSGMSYMWRIELPCTGPVEYVETLKESGPSTWSVGAETTISDDQTSAKTHTFGACFDGWIEHEWNINENDPPGEYLLTVEIAGYATQTFRPTFSRFQPPRP
jgi:hypothetical protein